MWPFEHEKRLEAEPRFRIQFWKKQKPQVRQPTIGERITSTYLPIAYIIGLCYLLYFVWRKRNDQETPKRRKVEKKVPASRSVLSSIPLKAPKQENGGTPRKPAIPGTSMTPARREQVHRKAMLNTQKPSKPTPLLSSQRGDVRPLTSLKNADSELDLTSTETSSVQGTQKRRNRQSRSDSRDSMRTKSRSPTSNRRRTKRSERKSRDSSPAASRRSKASSHRSRSPGVASKSRGRKKTKKERQQRVARDEMALDSLGNTAAPPRRRMGRRSSMPFVSSNAEMMVDTSSGTHRRSKSLERKIRVDPDEAPPIVMFPKPKRCSDGNISPRDLSLIKNSIRNRRGSLLGPTHCAMPGSPPSPLHVPSGGSIAGSIGMGSIGMGSIGMGSLCSTGTFVTKELERLKRTIERRGPDTSLSRAGSLRSIGSLSLNSGGSNGSNDSGAQLERLRMKLVRAKEDGCSLSLSSDSITNASSAANSLIESIVGNRSVPSLLSHESSLMDAFFDPSADAPPYLTIYYATQSGTSEFYAYALQQEGRAMGLDVGICNVSHLVHSIEMSLDQELNDVLIPHTTKSGKKRGRAVFLISTFHDGGPTDDGKGFIKALQGIKDHRYLKGLRYGVFGFGNSTFSTTYNTQGKLYDQLLSQLGGKRLVPLALGDDSKDIDWDFEKWKWQSWWPTLADLASRDNQTGNGGQPSVEGKTKRKSKSDADGADVKYVLEYITQADVDAHKERWDKVPLNATAKHFREGAFYAVKDVKPLWRDPDLSPKLKQSGSTMHISLDTTEVDGTPLDMKTGDNLAIVPHNRECLVEAVAKQLGYDLDAIFVLKPQNGTEEADFELPFPTPCTVRDYLTKYCELTTPPRRSMIRAFSKCAGDPEEREEMYQLSSKKHREKFMSRVIGERIGVGEFISSYYTSIEMPLVKLIGICCAMQPRWYSMSSSNLKYKQEAHLTLAMVSLPRTVDGSHAQGAASHYLGKIPIGEKVHVARNQPSGLTVPPDPTTPLILIANGSGIAPMLALIQERHHQKTELHSRVGPTELYFGIRRRDLDFLYRGELLQYKQAGSLTSLNLACSREQLHKIYVQHLVAKRSEHVWKLLGRGAHIYVCGGTSMSSEVEQVLRAVVSRHHTDTEVSVDQFIGKLKEEGRYIQEAFDANHV